MIPFQGFPSISQTHSHNFNPYPAEFLKWNNPTSIFGTVHKGYQYENLQLVSQQYRAWTDYTDVQTGLALY